MERSTLVESINAVGPYRVVEVGAVVVITDDGNEIARTNTPYVLHPDADISDQPADVQAVCNAVWTADIKAAWTAHQAEIAKGP